MAATAFNSFSLFSGGLVFFLFVCQLLVLSSAGGFTIDLIHRESPQSPFYNPSTIKSDRITNAFRRSHSRASHFKKLTHPPNNIQSLIIPTNGEYLMKLSIGTPSFELFAIADTGSDLTWTQCKPCVNCYHQNSPLFDPKKSTTYKGLSCQTQTCQIVDWSSCHSDTNNCQYRMSYGDQSYSSGDLAMETFTFGSTSGGSLTTPKMVFGCGNDNEGTFNDTAAGIIGLGGGSFSLVSQLSDVIHGKFSYCLVTDSNLSSKINFGDDALVSGPGVVSTPIVKKEVDTFYYLTLENIIVGNKSLTYKNTKLPLHGKSTYDGEEGNIIIDSGTTLTFLPSEMYATLESELKQVITGKTTQDPQGLLSLCYSDMNIDLPLLTFKLSGAELVLPPTSTFVQNGDLMCLGMVPSDELAILGNLSQMNFLIGYDLEKGQISFMPTDCSKY